MQKSKTKGIKLICSSSTVHVPCKICLKSSEQKKKGQINFLQELEIDSRTGLHKYL